MLLTIVLLVLAVLILHAAMSKSTVSVDKNNVVNAQSVVQDVTFSTASGNATLTPNRYTMVFSVSGGAWTHDSTTTYTPKRINTLY